MFLTEENEDRIGKEPVMFGFDFDMDGTVDPAESALSMAFIMGLLDEEKEDCDPDEEDEE